MAACGGADPLPQGTWTPRQVPDSPAQATPKEDLAQYPKMATLEKELTKLVGRCQPIAELHSYAPKTRNFDKATGSNVVSQPILAIKLSDNPKQNAVDETEVLFLALHHGREFITSSIAIGVVDRLCRAYAAKDPAIRALVDSHEIWVIPVVNPDGYDIALSQMALNNAGPNGTTRKNGRRLAGQGPGLGQYGVDPSRNYGSLHYVPTWFGFRRFNESTFLGQPDSFKYAGPGPFTEVETAAVRDLVSASPSLVDQFQCAISWHTGEQGVIYSSPFGASAFQNPANGTAGARRLAALYEQQTKARGYKRAPDPVPFLVIAPGDEIDWLTDQGIDTLVVEAYSDTEAGIDKQALGQLTPQQQAQLAKAFKNAGGFFPITGAGQRAVIRTNATAAINVAAACQSAGPPPIPDGGSDSGEQDPVREAADPPGQGEPPHTAPAPGVPN